MQSTTLKSTHHVISTLACLALAGTLAACVDKGTNGSNNKPTITFAETSLIATYKGANGGTPPANTATVTAKGKCTTPPAPSYSSSSANGPTQIVDSSTGVVTYKAAGSYRITASTKATTGESTCDAASNSYTLRVDKANVRLAFDHTTDSLVAGESKPIPATLTGVGGDSNVVIKGNSNIIYSSADTAKASVDVNSGDVTAGSNPTSVVITATFSGSHNYNGATDSYTLNISNNAPTITFNVFNPVGTNDTTSRDYIGASPGGRFTNDATVDLPGVEGSQCTSPPAVTYAGTYTSTSGRHYPIDASVDASSGEVTYKAAGKYIITASTADTTVDTTSDSSVCDAASASYTLIVNKVDADLTFDSSITRSVATGGGTVQNPVTLGNTTGDPTTTAAMGGTIRYSSANTSIAYVNLTTGDVTSTSSLDVTSVVIYASLKGSNNYRDVTASYTLDVSNSAPTLVFAAASADATYAGANPVAPAGTYTQSASVSPSGFCTTIPGVTYDVSGGSNNPTVDDDASGEVTYKAAGSYTITARTVLAPGCAVSDATAYTLNVAKANLVDFSFTDPTTSVLPGQTKPYLAIPKGVGGDTRVDTSGTIRYSSANKTLATVDANSGDVTAKNVDVTSVVITATYRDSSNYNDATARYTLNISNNVPTISFNTLSANDTISRNYIGASPGGRFTNDVSVTLPEGSQCTSPPAVTYTSTGGRSGSTDVSVDASGIVTYKAATPEESFYTITASTAETTVDSTCDAASASYKLEVAKATPTLVFTDVSVDVSTGRSVRKLVSLYGVGDDSISSGSLDNVTVTYFSDATSVTVNSTTGDVTAKLDGTADATINASYAGSYNYTDATASYTLRIRSTQPTIEFSATTSDGTNIEFSAGTIGVTYGGANPGGSIVIGVKPDFGGFCTAQSHIVIDPTSGAVQTTKASINADFSTDTSADKIELTEDIRLLGNERRLYYKAVGSYTITAHTVLAPGCAESADATFDLTVNKATPTLTFDNPPMLMLPDATAMVPARLTGMGGDSSTDMGGTISYSSDRTSDASVDANGTVTAGSDATSNVTITASYTSGSDNYTNATARYTFSIGQLKVHGSPIKKLIFSWQDVTDTIVYKLSKVDVTGGMNTQVGEDVAQGVQSITRIVPLYASADTQYRLRSCNGANICVTYGEVVTITQPQLNRAIGYIKASNTDEGDEFGTSLSLSADGTTLAVGAPLEDSAATGVGNDQGGGADYAGAVYVFSRDATTDDWSQQAYIKASNTGDRDYFGISLSLSADGTTLAVGANKEDSNATGVDNDQGGGADDAGAVYVFTRTSDGWSQQAYIKASNTDGSDQFGTSVSLDASGDTLAVGAPYEDSAATGVGNHQGGGAGNSGAVYVFTHDESTDGISYWSQQAYIKASNTGGGDQFGTSVSLDASGNTLAVGANREASWAGAVYAFSRDASDDWTQDAYIKASNTGGSDVFGSSVSLSADGTTLAVGAYYEDSSATGIGGSQADEDGAYYNDTGAVYVFSRPSSTSRDWTQDAYIKASNTDLSDYFGTSVSLDASGDTLAVGAKWEGSNATGIDRNQSNNSAEGAGAVYLY